MSKKFYKQIADPHPLRVDFCVHCRGTGVAPNNKFIGGELKRLRIEAQISLREMARRLKVSHGFLCQLEAGNRSWRPLVEERYIKETEKK